MKRVYRRWSMEQKRAAVSRMEGETATAIAGEHGISARELRYWRDQVLALDKKAHRGQGRERALEAENRRLKQALGAKALEVDFFQGVLRRIEAQRQPASGSGETASTRRSE